MKTHLKLATGQSMPALGLGTWASAPHQVGNAVTYAINEVGYRHIDAARIYGNEEEIGEAFNGIFSAKKIKRSDIFITSKLWNNAHNPDIVEAECRQTLKDLQLEYLDLYLMHWGIAFAPGNDPKPKDSHGRMKTEPISVQQTWQAMEKLVDAGLVKAIGVANFMTPQLIDLLTYARIRPAVNQIELHPYNAQTPLVRFCQDHQIVVTAYSPLGSPGNAGQGKQRLVDNQVVTSIATKHHKTPAQVLINWGLLRNTIVIPKSVTPSRIAENFEVFDFELTTAEIKQLDELDQRFRYVDPADSWGIPYFN